MTRPPEQGAAAAEVTKALAASAFVFASGCLVVLWLGLVTEGTEHLGFRLRIGLYLVSAWTCAVAALALAHRRRIVGIPVALLAWLGLCGACSGLCTGLPGVE